MTFSATCPNPMHRLFALVGGRERIDREMQDGWPSLLGAVAYLILEEHGPDEWVKALALILEAAPRPPADPVAEATRLGPEFAEQVWVGHMAAAAGLDPETGEPGYHPPIRDRPVRRHRHRRSSRYRR